MQNSYDAFARYRENRIADKSWQTVRWMLLLCVHAGREHGTHLARCSRRTTAPLWIDQ